MPDTAAAGPPGPGGSDFLQLDPAAAPGRGLTSWLAAALRSAIRDGRLAAGAALPPTRVLAADLRISRGVVVEAYQRLRDEGLIGARPGAGTVVLAPPAPLRPPGLPAPGAQPAPAAPARAAPGAAALSAAALSAAALSAAALSAAALAAAAAAGNPGPAAAAAAPGSPFPLPRRWRADAEIDLSPGVPDLSAFPRAAWPRAERAVLAQASAADLGYGDPRGSERLRAELAGWLARTRGVRADPGAIIVVAGVAQALALLAQVLRARGATDVAVEDPGSRGARDELAHWGLRPAGVPVDEHGLQLGPLAASGAGTVLLTPAHQFPTGVVLAPQRRRGLLDWAAAGGLIIEDDYDAEYRYDRAPVAALQASAPGRIAYAGSVSKTLAPGMRLGWLVAPDWLRDELTAAKHASDLGCAVLQQLVLARLIGGGELARHIRQVRIRQRRRRDALLGALREFLPAAGVQGIPAGLHLLITFPGGHAACGSAREASHAGGQAGNRSEGGCGGGEAGNLGDGGGCADGGGGGEVLLDDVALAAELRAAGVLVHPLSWHRLRPGPPGLVLGYAAHPPGELREAASRIAAAVAAASA